MANRVEITKLLDGSKYLIYHVYLESDGMSGDLDDFVLIDPEDETMGDATQFTIEDITWSFNGFSASIAFEYLTSGTLVWVLSPNIGGSNFCEYGGLKDRSDPMDASGRVLLSTVDFVDDGDMGSLIIKVRKG